MPHYFSMHSLFSALSFMMTFEHLLVLQHIIPKITTQQVLLDLRHRGHTRKLFPSRKFVSYSSRNHSSLCGRLVVVELPIMHADLI
jgi:hypothetical protein